MVTSVTRRAAFTTTSWRALAAAGVLLLTAGVAAEAADRALVIGIDGYADQRLSASGRAATNDAAAIRATLTGKLGYADSDVRVLVDGQATRAAILSGFNDWLVAGTRPGDRAFLYFAGLGFYEADTDGDEADGLDETLLPHDAVVDAGGAAIGNTVSDDDIHALAVALAGRKVTVVVDAGHAGIVSVQGSTASTANVRAVALPKTRAIGVRPRVKAQKAEGAPLDTYDLGQDVAVFTATSGGQAPVADAGGGKFTEAYVEAVAGSADVNDNGRISNAEILAYVRDKAQAACGSQGGCDLGLTPTLEPAGAAAGTPYAGAGGDALTYDGVLDYFAAGNDGYVRLDQVPPSPVRVGARNIRFRVTSSVAGNLILLDVSDEGRLVQLFPNQFTRDRDRAGVVLANSPITVPDDYYGISFDATDPSSGTLIALVTHEAIDMPAQVKTRAIGVIARKEATEAYLPAIAEALGKPVDTAVTTPTRALGWSVATLRYEIVP